MQDENRLSADPEKRQQQLMMMEYTKVTVTEKKIEENFDEVANSVA